MLGDDLDYVMEPSRWSGSLCSVLIETSAVDLDFVMWPSRWSGSLCGVLIEASADNHVDHVDQDQSAAAMSVQVKASR